MPRRLAFIGSLCDGRLCVCWLKLFDKSVSIKAMQ